ncbi:hypothetical protein ACH5RR_019635 [Cinchona calisaya]|uniref:non-specific serine/threonine protein kinase n=1 Tax=Cinchona calisaya TaxID=153742 RepID=A0ABD2ZRL1_9GENT
MSKFEGVLERSPDGRFIRYDEVLGRGGFKKVYKGFDQENGTEVAWYQINLHESAAASEDLPKFTESLLSEAALMKSLKHNNIIKCYSSWVDKVNMNMNMITELFMSGTLRQFRLKHKSLNINKVIKNWARQILKGLHYLHSQNPPIVHRDLKCDNIFINANHGEIKIGDLGLATMLNNSGFTKGVLGTPEFMAPEVYNDEEYNELVDIYAFGMCLLEMITRDYPYSECKNVVQIFKKVTTGVKPIALGKIMDPQVKGLIEKCLSPAAQRPSAAELLKDPFFSSSEPLPKSINVPKPDVSMVESTRSTEQIQLRLRGKRIDEKTVSFNLRIADLHSSVANCFEFLFDLKADDALKVALEMVQGNDLKYQDVPIAVELMDSMLLELEPAWKPFKDYFNATNNVVSGCRELSSNWQLGSVVH